jgi:hypothetical protein
LRTCAARCLWLLQRRGLRHFHRISDASLGDGLRIPILATKVVPLHLSPSRAVRVRARCDDTARRVLAPATVLQNAANPFLLVI